MPASSASEELAYFGLEFAHIWTMQAQPWMRYKESVKLYERNLPSLASLASKMTARNS